MTATLTTAVIGTGAISREHLACVAREKLARIVGVCDLSRASARFAASQYDGVQPFTNHREMLDTVRPDVVHILTPPQTHASLATDCLNAGCHVLVEKPVTPSHAEFQRLRATAEHTGQRLVEDHNYRFNEPVQRIEELVGTGALGEVREVDVRMALGLHAGSRYSDRNLPHPSHQLPAGVLHEFLPHLAYLALRFLPSVDRVTALWSNKSRDPMFKYDDLDAIVVGGDVHARIRFTSQTQPDEFTLTVRGTCGAAHADLFQPALRIETPRRPGPLSPLLNQFAGGVELVSASVANFRRKILQATPYEGMHTFLRRTYAALARGGEPPVTYDDMDQTSRLIDALVAEGRVS